MPPKNSRLLTITKYILTYMLQWKQRNKRDGISLALAQPIMKGKDG